MKSTVLKSIKLTLAFCLFSDVFYVGVLWLFAQIAGPSRGNAEWVTLNGKVVGAAHIGQLFTKNIYFWGRPSAVDYAADGSGGSNHGPSNPIHLATVERRIQAFLEAHPYLERDQVPAEIVTASASGLDPHISPAAAYVQVKRVAQARGLDPQKVKALVDALVEHPLGGILGPSCINVLKLNVALEARGAM